MVVEVDEGEADADEVDDTDELADAEAATNSGCCFGFLSALKLGRFCCWFASLRVTSEIFWAEVEGTGLVCMSASIGCWFLS